MVAQYCRFMLFLPRYIARCAVLLIWFAGMAAGVTHTSDIEADSDISLSELLRVIQFYNSDGFGCDAVTEDGYVPGGGETECAPHDSDYAPRDWRIALSELLRLVQLYNSARYHTDPDGEDGFAPGLGAAWVRQYPVVDAPHADVHVAGAALAPDGGLYVVGSAEDGVAKAMLLHIDAAGGLAWSRLFEFGGGAQASGIAVNPDGSLILVGSKRQTLGSKLEAFVLRTDADGNPVGESTLPASGHAFLSALLAASDGLLYGAGAVEPVLNDGYDALVARIDPEAAIVGTQSYNLPGCTPGPLQPCSEWAGFIVETVGHGFLLGSSILADVGPASTSPIVRHMDSTWTQTWLWVGPAFYTVVPPPAIVEFQNGVVFAGLAIGSSLRSSGVFLSPDGVELQAREYAVGITAALNHGEDALVAGLTAGPAYASVAIAQLTSRGILTVFDAFPVDPDPEVAALLRAPSGACYIVGATLDDSSSNSEEWRGQALVIKTLPVF